MPRKPLTHEEFMEKFYIKNENAENIEILGEYKGSKIKIKCRCKIDGYEWETIPNSLLNGRGCPKCYNNRRCDILRKTTEEFMNELKEINEYIEVLGEYVNSYTKIKVRCKIDGYEWKVTPNSLLNGYGCPKCNESKGEKRIAKYLDSRDIEYKREHKFDDCRSKKKLPFDFYIPSLNVAIEYDGGQHYKIVKHFGGLDNFIIIVIRDTIKTKYCEKNNIKLIRIPYWDFDNIEEILEKEL